MTSLRRRDIEAVLAEFHGRSHCVLSNRGTTALAAAFHALNRPGEAVVFPAVMCSIPVFAAAFAGMRPVFADVSLETGNFDLASLETACRTHRPAAVVPVHMFGRPEDMDAVASIAGRSGASVVEDVALSMGASRGGRRTGSFGNISCLSFVRKMIPLEMGGALLTDDPDLAARARSFLESLPPGRPEHRPEISPAMKAFHALTGYAAAGDWKRRELLMIFEDEFRRLFLTSTTEDDWKDSIVLSELAGLDAVVSARRVRAEVLENALVHPRVLPLRHDDSCFFTYPVRLPGIAVEEFLAFASSEGYAFNRIAYPDVSPIFSSSPDGFPNAATLEKEGIGFPVDDDQPVSSFWSYAEDFLVLLDRFLALPPKPSPFDWRGKMEMRMAT